MIFWYVMTLLIPRKCLPLQLRFPQPARSRFTLTPANFDLIGGKAETCLVVLQFFKNRMSLSEKPSGIYTHFHLIFIPANPSRIPNRCWCA